jgi:hypothetical protein
MSVDSNCEAPNLKKQIAYLNKQQWPIQKKHEAIKWLPNVQLRITDSLPTKETMETIFCMRK